jgi:chorismate mutase
MTTTFKEGLQRLRDELLKLHKALVDSERVTYEQTVGAIKSPSHFLQLLSIDPWFAWLQPMSQLIVVMDEALEEKEPLTAASAEALFRQARLQLVVSETGDGFSKHYYDALQRDPDVVLAHAEVTKALKSRSSN